MKKFLVQVDEKGIVRQDFGIQIINSVEFHRWKFERIDYDYFLTDKVYDLKSLETYMPIGDLEFTLKWFDLLQIERPKPINIPKELWNAEFLEREVEIFKGDLLNLYEGKKFIKELDVFKGETTVIMPGFRHKFDKNKSYLVSDWIDLKSEWRFFVFENKIIGGKNYVGDIWTVPDREKVESMVSTYGKKGPYTLDVAITEDDKTVLIEVHDFFSCGLYGFSDYLNIIKMYEKFFENKLIEKYGTI